MRKQIGIKFEETDVERWDQWAAERGYTRTTLIEAALEAFISGRQVLQKPPTPESEPEASESQPAEEKSPPRARPGIRHAYVCGRCARRIFLPWLTPQGFVPECHNQPMVRQPNHPYFGQATG